MLKKMFLYLALATLCPQVHAWERGGRFGGFSAQPFVYAAIWYGATHFMEAASKKSTLELAKIENAPDSLTRPAPKAIQDKVRDLCKKIGVDFSSIEVRENKNASPEDYSSASAFRNKYLYIHKSFYNETPKEQEATLGHELIHLKYNDGYNNIARPYKVAAATLMGLEFGAFGIYKASQFIENEALRNGQFGKALKSRYIKENVPNIVGNLAFQYITSVTVGFWEYFRYRKFCEQRADIESVRLAGTAEGHLSHFKKRAAEDPIQKDLDFIDDSMNEFYKSKRWGRYILGTIVRDALHFYIDSINFFSSHPTARERVLYIEKEVRKENARKRVVRITPQSRNKRHGKSGNS